ncbi:hypothetical protein Tco_1114204 [Tanacetum coccineum]|uniref:Uncharacterized protein n=1 Tax=Tanacetum coccineum TaxID=301880 RepID=A0ABQ5IUE6_9ASTR
MAMSLSTDGASDQQLVKQQPQSRQELGAPPPPRYQPRVQHSSSPIIRSDDSYLRSSESSPCRRIIDRILLWVFVVILLWVSASAAAVCSQPRTLVSWAYTRIYRLLDLNWWGGALWFSEPGLCSLVMVGPVRRPAHTSHLASRAVPRAQVQQLLVIQCLISPQMDWISVCDVTLIHLNLS